MKHKRPSSNKKKQKNKNKKGKSSSFGKATKMPSIDEYVQAGDAAAEAMELEKALEYYQAALQQQQQQQQSSASLQVQILEKQGEVKATMGDHAAAKHDFEQAISVLQGAKEETAQFYEMLAGLHLYIGQLGSDHEALEAYKKGLVALEQAVELRSNELNKKESKKQQTEDDAEMEVEADNKSDEAQILLKETRQKLCSARATVAELYLTDLCMEENAETECESYVCLALKLRDEQDQPMPDALQTAASLRLSQQRNPEARRYILQVYSQLQKGCEALAKLVGLDTTQKQAVELTDEEGQAADALPSMEFRLQTSKLLLECATFDDNIKEQQQCYQSAIYVLGSLLAENDEVPEVFYLLGCAYNGCKNVELAKDYWTRALEMLAATKQDLEQHGTTMNDEDDELDMQLQSIDCQMEEIHSKLEDLGGDEEEDTAMDEE